MICHLNGQSYRFWFRHEHFPKPQLWPTGVKWRTIQAVTRCYISPGGQCPPGATPEILAIGVARCSTLDQFRKETGRVLSLRRALAMLFEDHWAWAPFWEAYRQRRRSSGTIGGKIPPSPTPQVIIEELDQWHTHKQAGVEGGGG